MSVWDFVTEPQASQVAGMSVTFGDWWFGSFFTLGDCGDHQFTVEEVKQQGCRLCVYFSVHCVLFTQCTMYTMYVVYVVHEAMKIDGDFGAGYLGALSP